MAVHSLFSLRSDLRRALFLCALILISPAVVAAQGTQSTSAPGSYSLGDVLVRSAFGGDTAPFTPLSLWNR
jgi:hypothetical protein